MSVNTSETIIRVLERTLMTVAVVSLFLLAQLCIDVPNRDIPDVKDIPVLFPGLQ